MKCLEMGLRSCNTTGLTNGCTLGDVFGGKGGYSFMSNSLTRKDIYEKVREQVGLPYAESHRLLDQMFVIVREGLKRGEDIKIARFGVFAVHHKKARIGRNPKTKREVMISERYSISFRASGLLKERIRHANQQATQRANQQANRKQEP